MKRVIFCPLLLILLLASPVIAQTDSLRAIDINSIGYAQMISGKSSSTFIGPHESLEQRFDRLDFTRGMIYTQTVPPKDVSKKMILRFSVVNNADTTSSVWFFPGFYYLDVHLYREQASKLTPLPTVLAPIPNNLGYRKITVLPHDSFTVYAELYQLRTYINTMRPRLIHKDRLNFFITVVQADHDSRNMVTFVFCGLLLMMILFSVANYVQGANKEFLYYSLYALFLGGMLFTKANYDFSPSHFCYFMESYLDFIMQCLGHGFYMFFMQRFLAARRRHPFLHTLYNVGVLFLLVAMLAFSVAHFLTNNYVAEYWIENITRFVLLGMTVIFLVYSIRKWNDNLMRYVFWGNLCLFIFSLLSQLSLMMGLKLPGILGNSLFYYEVGLFLELVFFLAGLNYKNRRFIIQQTKERERLKTENQLKEYEKELAVYKAQQEERQRISADMHDELGAGMTAIRLMSEIARNKMKESTPVEIEKISHSADEVLNKMNAIIWSMNSGNDTLDNLVSYIRSYALEYFENTPIDCRVITPPDIAPLEITGDKRRNIFLCIKETLNNALKHSKATAIRIEFEIDHELVIRISDNGVGIDMQNLRKFGNGLKNITRRMDSIDGNYLIENKNGTVTTLTLPL